MKRTSYLFGLLAVPTVLAFVISGCGGSGQNNRLPGGRPSFTFAISDIISPQDNEQDVCPQPEIKFEFPAESTQCSQPETVSNAVVLFEQGLSVEDALEFNVPVARAWKDSALSNNDKCVVVTLPQFALDFNVTYRVGASNALDPSIDFDNQTIGFKTVSSQNYDPDSCPQQFTVNQSNIDLAETTILDTGSQDDDGDGIVFEEDDFLDFGLNLLAQAGFEQGVLGTGKSSQFEVEVEFNKRINPEGLANHVFVYEVNFGQNGEPTAFAPVPGFDACSDCIRVSSTPSTQGKQLIISGPGTGWVSGSNIAVFISEEMDALNGALLDKTNYGIFPVQ